MKNQSNISPGASLTQIQDGDEMVSQAPVAHSTVMAVLFAISFSHCLNDTIQALLPSIYPMLRDSFHLNFAQLGWITFTFQCTASLFQPLVGFVTDKKPMPHSLAVGMSLTLVGLLALAFANSYPLILMAAATVGLGSAVFHPEASRLAHMAAGARRGFAQSFSSLAEILAAHSVHCSRR
jgi:FSR family fosmidomycin resistance protein-like MFS transporter